MSKLELYSYLSIISTRSDTSMHLYTSTVSTRIEKQRRLGCSSKSPIREKNSMGVFRNNKYFWPKYILLKSYLWLQQDTVNVLAPSRGTTCTAKLKLQLERNILSARNNNIRNISNKYILYKLGHLIF